MAGHSKWANIRHRKGAQDAKRGKIFTKIAKEITIAARMSGGDPEANPRLRLVLQKARGVNMPNDNIQRAIKRGTGDMDGVNYEELTYEGYAPGGVATMVECLTDNKNRTVAEVRHIFGKRGGSLGENGCVAWMFNRKGQIAVSAEGVDEEEFMLAALDAGAEDVTNEGEEFEVTTEPDAYEDVYNALEAAGYRIGRAEVSLVPENTVPVETAEDARKLMAFMEALEDSDDVQNVTMNFDIPDEIMEQLDS